MIYLIALVSGFASGVFLRSLFIFNWAPIVFSLLLATLFAGAIFFITPRRTYVLGLLFCIFVSLGMIRAHVAESPLPQSFASELRHRVSYEGVVIADPDMRDATERVEVQVESGGESAKLLVVAPRTTRVAVGDRVRVSGTLLLPQPFASEGGRTFRYDKYLEQGGVRFILNFASIHVYENAPWYSLPAALAKMKHAFLNGLQAALPEPYASLAGGIVIGGKSGLGAELQNAFVRSGLVQIIVLSGYNVMVVAEWIMIALASIRISHRWSSFAGALAILTFVGIAGVSATALRAMCMALIALYARATGRTYAAGRALLFVVFLMLVWNPLSLVFDPGFGLSVTATAGLIWLAPALERCFAKMKNAFWKNAFATTLAAQIAVLPLLLYDTGNLSLVALPATLLTLPIVPFAMGLSALAGCAGIIFNALAPIVGIVLALPAYLLNAYVLFIAQKAAMLPLAAFTLPAFPFWLVLLSYAALILTASSKRFSTTDQLRFAKNASM